MFPEPRATSSPDEPLFQSILRVNDFTVAGRGPWPSFPAAFGVFRGPGLESNQTCSYQKAATSFVMRLTKSSYVLEVARWSFRAGSRIFWGSARLPPTAKLTGKGGGLRPPPFPMGSAVGGGPLGHQK